MKQHFRQGCQALNTGKFLFEYGETRVEGGPATYMFLRRDIPHCFQHIGDTTGKMLAICQPAGLESFFEEVSMLQGPPDPAKIDPVAQKWGMEILGPPIGHASLRVPH